MTTRAKFTVNSITRRKHWDKTKSDLFDVDLGVVTSGGDENEAFFASSPSGYIKLSAINESALAAFPLGGEVYVDFTPA